MQNTPHREGNVRVREGILIEKGEEIGMHDVQSPEGFSLRDDAGDADLTRACR